MYAFIYFNSIKSAPTRWPVIHCDTFFRRNYPNLTVSAPSTFSQFHPWAKFLTCTMSTSARPSNPAKNSLPSIRLGFRDSSGQMLNGLVLLLTLLREVVGPIFEDSL